MLPGFDPLNFNPKKMHGMMKQLGIEINEIKDAESVIINTKNEEIIIENPTISIMKTQGSETYQISGLSKVVKKKITPLLDDINFVCQATGVSIDKVKKMLIYKNGNIAEAINELKK